MVIIETLWTFQGVRSRKFRSQMPSWFMRTSAARFSEDVNFRGAQLSHPNFTGAVLIGMDPKDVPVPARILEECLFDASGDATARANKLKAIFLRHEQVVSSGTATETKAVLDHDDLRPLNGFFPDRKLAGLSARGVIAVGVDFSKCQLQAANFDGADLRSANFTGADLRGLSLKGAKIAHAQLDSADIREFPLASGRVVLPDLTGTVVAPRQLESAILSQSVVELGAASA